MQAHASPSDEAPYPHPFLTGEGQLFLAEVADTLGTTDSEEILVHISVDATIEESASGWSHHRTFSFHDRGTPVAKDGDAEFMDAPAMGDWLQDALVAANPNDSLPVVVCTRRYQWMPVVSVPHELDRAMIEREVETWGDVRALRRDVIHMIERAGDLAIRTALSPYYTDLDEIEEIYGMSGCADVLAAPSVVERMSLDPAFASVDRSDLPSALDAGYGWTVLGGRLDGRDLEDLIQSTQFYEAGYGGSDRLAYIENNDVFRGHLGFDGASGDDRVQNCGSPGGTPLDCTSNPNPQGPGNTSAHTTAGASMVVGDITAGQDTGISDPMERRARSGVARTATLLAVDKNHDWQSIVPNQGDIELAVKTNGPGGGGDQCPGTYATSQFINTLFEAGVAVFHSNGNNGHTSPTACTVNNPGQAIGAFTVGAYIVDGSEPNPSHEEIIEPSSSRGGAAPGSTGEGRGRTIIALSAPSNYEYAYPHYDPRSPACVPGFYYGTDWQPLCSPDGFTRSSSATPVVAGAAALLKDFWLEELGWAIAQPERIYTQMLLLGDRTGEGGTHTTTGFDSLWGAGKLRLRMYDGGGMDAPSLLKVGKRCVGPSEDVFVSIQSQTQPNIFPDVDMLKVVAFWYDSRHDAGIDHDKIDMAVQYQDGTTWVDAAESATDDNRQHVFIASPPSGMPYRVRFHGRDVSNEYTACGTDSAQVWYAAFFEDSDRDDGPHGGEPENIRPDPLP